MKKEENNKEEQPFIQDENETNDTTSENNDAVEKEDTAEEKDFEKLYHEANDKYLRLYSEFDNFRRRTAKERMELIKSAGSDVLKSILPVLDDLERAIKVNETAADIDSVKEGFKLIESKFTTILQNKGLKKMELMGTTFDSDIAEAIANMPVEDESQKGKIIDVLENGYYLNDTVIRFAKVVIGQ